VVKGKVVGALDVQSNQANAFTEEDLAVLTTLANQIAVAIDNARLFEQAEHRASDMSLLFAVTTAAASAENLEEALQMVTEDLLDSMSARAVAIYLPVVYVDELTDETYSYLRMTAGAGIPGALNRFKEVKVGDSDNMIGTVASNFRSTIIDRVQEEPLYQSLVADAQAAMVVPLVSGAHLVGVIVLESVQAFAYDHESLTLLQTMGGSLSAIIQNAQLLARLQQTNDQLLELDRIKSEFLANMSHELRTPLNSIIGFSRVILKGIDGPLTEMQEQDLSTIYDSGQHLLGLINDILDQAKIAAGKMELKPDYFDLKSVIEGVRSIGIGLVKEKQVSIRMNIESGLPQVYADEFRTRQVLINLVSNAAKFTTEGSITLSAYRYFDVENQRNMIRVDVADTGIGIDEDDMDVLFEAFRQVDSSLTRTAGGTGLGLPISKSLVELQGGQMMLDSKVNVGSTFSLTLPLEPVDVAAEKPQEELDQAATLELKQVSAEDELDKDDTLRLKKADVRNAIRKNGNGHDKGIPTVLPPKRQLLVIEDNPDRVDQFRRVLQREGFDVFTASIPLEAEAMASGLRPAVIVMDVNFAEGKGWEILSRIKDRDDTFDIPVIVVTLSSESERAYQVGAYHFLQHPIMPDQLVESVLEAEKESSAERILIIDDQPESTRLLTQVLDMQGKYRIFSAHNGIEGVSMVARRRPDLVILDLRMPEMDGFAVLEELRANPETANIPILVVTGDMLTSSEHDLLSNVSLLYKSDISLEDYQRFITDVETQLLRNGE
ncbi:MAG: response regulator, partial [Anaerolineae bacterium]|nr:response regulator [Anaerolineae bacterium]